MTSSPAPRPHDQSTYQVRLEWGPAGLARLAPSDIVVVVDVLDSSTRAVEAAAAGEEILLDRLDPVVGEIARIAGPDAIVLAAGLVNARAVAEAVLAEQTRRAGRTSVAIIAAGELVAADAAGLVHPAVEDQLGAGAVVAALGDLGIDHTSPDAAVAAEGFRALRGAVRHLLTASGSGRAMAARGERESVAGAAAHDSAGVVPVLRDGGFRTL